MNEQLNPFLGKVLKLKKKIKFFILKQASSITLQILESKLNQKHSCIPKINL